MESSQNSEDKIKSLFKPVLKSLGMDDILVTNGFAWRESIPLRSTIDLATHAYAPKSDVAIVQLLPSSSFSPSSCSTTNHSTETPKILVIFEAYSKCGQSHTTPDSNRADRMETILVFPSEGGEAAGGSKFCYYVEKRPFYEEASWVSLLCQVINLVWAQRHMDS
ncbi:hypothetical protein BC629DRAFT_120832 [Irpex lacteus]|nr:hypothetical protein BC629DRAFT_120832 [Irpex lacteus]